MTPEQKKQLEFCKKFGINAQDKPTIPLLLDKKLSYNLIHEELNEFYEAMKDNNIIEVADALGDLIYVVYCAANIWGIDLEDIFNEIHRSNMTKVWSDGTVHRRPEDGKILKPQNYSPAELTTIITFQLMKGVDPKL